MSKAKTGALIVIEQNTPLAEYENRYCSGFHHYKPASQINIFEHNTSLMVQS